MFELWWLWMITCWFSVILLNVWNSELVPGRSPVWSAAMENVRRDSIECEHEETDPSDHWTFSPQIFLASVSPEENQPLALYCQSDAHTGAQRNSSSVRLSQNIPGSETGNTRARTTWTISSTTVEINVFCFLCEALTNKVYYYYQTQTQVRLMSLPDDLSAFGLKHIHQQFENTWTQNVSGVQPSIIFIINWSVDYFHN